MLLAAFFSWWYGDGWKGQIENVRRSLVKISDTFSIPLLVKTLFAPFRQISAGNVDGPIGLRFRAALDKLFSRLIGAFVRTIMIFVGIFGMILLLIFSAVRLLLWPLMPVLPIAGFVLMTQVGTPWM